VWTTFWPPSGGLGSTPAPRSPEADLTSILLTVLGVLAFAVGLLFSIAFHEAGHFFWARRFGMRVPQFMVGFGPTLWSRRRGETEYGIKAIPLGGYIRIVGMIPPAEEGESKRATRMRSFIAEVRGAALNDVLPTDRDRVFYAKPWWQRVIVMFAGPFHNLVLAVVFLVVLLVGIGLPTATTTVQAVPACVLPVAAGAGSDCSRPVDPAGHPCPPSATDCRVPEASPAAKAGLRPGDRILAVNGTPVSQEPKTGWAQLVQTIQASANRPLTMTVTRDGQTRQVTVTPIENRFSDGSTVRTAGYLGVQSAEAYVRQPLQALPGYFGTILTQSVQRLAQIPQRIPQLVRATFLGEQRDPNGPIGLVGVGRISGEAFAQPDVTTLEKVSFLLGVLGSVNLALFLFNLLPIYPLDGGHVAGAVYERLRAAVARMRGRPDPGPFDIARLMPVAYAVAGVFLLMSGLLAVADIINPVRL
jgi:membrane-associated protease RseP (regulator of RpoE activity)